MVELKLKNLPSINYLFIYLLLFFIYYFFYYYFFNKTNAFTRTKLGVNTSL